jgi:peptidoglycan/xylan/chitin deacetylase (PgdA/CDA1 family)
MMPRIPMTPTLPIAASALSFAIPAAAAAVSAAAALGYGIFHPRARVFGTLHFRAPKGCAGNGVALTFDDGPTPGGTDRVLDVLAEVNAKAAFFVVGRHALAHPGLVRRIDAEGHLVANHTFDHSHTATWGRARWWRWEIGRADDAIAQVLGKRPALFRPPMGLKSVHTMREARRHGHTVVTWALRGVDTRPGASVESILHRVARPAGPGDVLLLHDGIEPFSAPRDLSPTIGAVAPLVRSLRGRGMEPVRLDQLLGVRAYRPAEENAAPRFLGTPAPPKWT